MFIAEGVLKNIKSLVCVYIVWIDEKKDEVVFTLQRQDTKELLENEAVLYSIIVKVLSCFPERKQDEISSWGIKLVH